MNGSSKFYSPFLNPNSNERQKIHVLTAEQMKAAEELHFLNGCSPMALMENAIQSMASYIKLNYPQNMHKRVVVLVGTGGNGADGAGIARVLQQSGYHVLIFQASSTASEACLNQLSYAKFMGANLLPENAEPHRLVELCCEADLVIDALLGFGFTGKIKPQLAALIHALNAALNSGPAESKRARCKIIAVDLPSGLPPNGETHDSGDNDNLVHGVEALQAHETLCLGHLKVCLADDSYSKFYGKVTVVDIQLSKIDPQYAVAELVDCDQAIRDLRAILCADNPSLNKYSRGRCTIFAGSLKYPGAGELSTAGALAAGSGYVNIVTQDFTGATPNLAQSLSRLPRYASAVPLSTDCFHTNQEYGGFNIHESTKISPKSCLFGPGITDFSRQQIDFMREWKGPLVLDAGALEPAVCLEIFPLPATAPLNSPRIITPHRGEFERIWTCFCERNRQALERPSLIEKTKRISQSWNCTVVLKGATTIVSFPAGKTCVLLGANNSLARAGTGDVLAGFLSGLLSRNIPEETAVCAAICIHNEAARALTKNTSKYLDLALVLPNPCFPSDLAQAMTQIMYSLER